MRSARLKLCQTRTTFAADNIVLCRRDGGGIVGTLSSSPAFERQLLPPLSQFVGTSSSTSGPTWLQPICSARTPRGRRGCRFPPAFNYNSSCLTCSEHGSDGRGSADSPTALGKVLLQLGNLFVKVGLLSRKARALNTLFLCAAALDSVCFLFPSPAPPKAR